MSKNKKVDPVVPEPEVTTVVNNVPPTKEQLSEQDKANFEIAKLNRKLAVKEAEKALAEHNAAEASYKYLILQLYMKYGMTHEDAFDDQGNILRGINKQQG